MIISYIGHASFVLSGTKKIIIDPYFDKKNQAKAYNDRDYDYILLTHGHGDHSSGALDIAQNSGATILSIVELASIMEEKGAKSTGFNIGGTFDDGEVKIKMTQAFHSSSYISNGQRLYAGPPVGYIIRMDGICMYYPGDTGLFYDMSAVIARENIDIAFLPIGDFFTMGIDDAVTAAKWLNAKKVIPMHYDTFPEIRQDVSLFAQKIKNETQSECLIIKPGKEILI